MFQISKPLVKENIAVKRNIENISSYVYVAF